MRNAWLVVVVVVGCKGKEPADKPGSPAGSPAGTTGAVPTKPSIKSGELVVSGAVTGTFHWQEDLALTCMWVPSLKTGGLDVTMTDGNNTYMAFSEHVGERNDVIFTSGALKSAAALTGKTGFTMTGSDDATRMSVTVDSELTSSEGTKVTIEGKLELACPP